MIATECCGTGNFCGILFLQWQIEFHFRQIPCRACAVFGYDNNASIQSRRSIADFNSKERRILKKTPYLTLQPSEQTIVTAAATIYAAYIAGGVVEDGQENAWMDRALKAAFRIAKVTDETVQADRELD